MLFAIVLTIFTATMACQYKGEKYKDGDTWVVRSTFVMKCKINRDGSWSTKVIGCRTSNGVIVEPGRTLSEGDTTYECTAKSDGRVEIKRTYQLSRKQISCEGHAVGESWVSQHNFHKTCTESGARITECLTDAGIPVPINQHLVLSGIKYTCTRFSNGTVIINREGLPSPATFKNNLKPVEVLGPMWKSFRSLGSLLLPEEQSDKRRQEIAVAPVALQLDQPTTNVTASVKCISGGKTYHPEETWISEKKFTKKCTPDGSIVILNCLLDDNKSTININTELKVGKKTYKCYRKENDERVYFEISTEE
uniref:Ig-like domain-containing protein n=1 Tax=Haemonchus contortus TaxID=6289 RepID=A0A7I5EC76_HAECO